MRILVNAKNRSHAFDCEPDEKILHAGLRQGIELPYECGSGSCGTCKARLLHGELRDAWPDAPGRASLKAGAREFLMCQGVPVADCALEVASIVNTMPPGACVPAHVTGIVRRRTMLTQDVARLEVALARPLDFEAGQFVLMAAAGIAGARAYSMVNFERKAERLDFVVKKKPGGRMTEWLFGDAAEGAAVRLFGPLGFATFHPGVGKHLLCIAGGSGVAGMMSILARACAERYFDGYSGWVFFGVRGARDLFFLDELAAFRARYPERLTITIALSDEDVDPALPGRHPGLRFARGLVHAVAAAAMRGRFQNVRAYAAGPPPMVDATLRMLLMEGRLSSADIRYDKFS